MTSLTRLQCIQQSNVWSELLPSTPTSFTPASYDPSLHDWSFVRILIAGAGGIGCELLHQVAMCGFANITIIDMDKVELSNLNRQFLFRETDIGQYKSVVAAKYIHDRFTGIHVEAVVGRIENQSDNFYKSFHAILLALDTVEARIWINNKIASLATRSIITQRTKEANITSVNNANYAEETDSTNTTTDTEETCIRGFLKGATDSEVIYSHDMCVITHATFMIDTGTEGYQGHCRIIDMSCNHTPCIECERELFVPEQHNVALCTLHHYPRKREDCVLYAAHVEFPKEYQPQSKTLSASTCEEREKSSGQVELDVNNVEHIKWVCEHARARQELFQVDLHFPIDVMYTRGVLEHIVPAVNFTNSFVAGEAVLELMKWLWGVGRLLNNFAMINGAARYGGIHFHTESLKTDKLECGWGVTSCVVCSPMPVMDVSLHMTINEIDKLIDNIYSYNFNNKRNNEDNRQQNSNAQTTRDQNATSTLVFSCKYNSENAENINSVTDNVQHRIFLSYREGHPLAKTICGNTLHDVLVHEYHLESFVQEWQHRWRLHWHKHNEMNTSNRRSHDNHDTSVNVSTAHVTVTSTNEVIIPVIERVAHEGMPTRRVALRLVY